MTNTQIEVITSVECRRRWSQAEKERLVAASLEPGAVVSAIAREAGIHPSQLYGWRRQLCVRPQASATFAAVRIAFGGAGEACIAEYPGRDRDRVCKRVAHSDHRSGRPDDTDGSGCHAGAQRTAAMIPVPSGVQVWLATGHTDMRNYAERTIMLSPRQLAEYPHCSAVA
jgi:transposase